MQQAPATGWGPPTQPPLQSAGPPGGAQMQPPPGQQQYIQQQPLGAPAGMPAAGSMRPPAAGMGIARGPPAFAGSAGPAASGPLARPAGAPGGSFPGPGGMGPAGPPGARPQHLMQQPGLGSPHAPRPVGMPGAPPPGSMGFAGAPPGMPGAARPMPQQPGAPQQQQPQQQQGMQQPSMQPPGAAAYGGMRPPGGPPPMAQGAGGFAPGMPGPPFGPRPMGPPGTAAQQQQQQQQHMQQQSAAYPGAPQPWGADGAAAAATPGYPGPPQGPPSTGFAGGAVAGMPGHPPGPGFAPGAHPPGPPGMPGGFDAYAGQRLVEAFESLVISAGPGAPEVDGGAFPRPVAEEREPARAAQPPFDKANCSPDNMRPTVMGVPNSTALRLRWQLPLGVIVRPMADEACGHGVPVIPLGNQGIIRCRRCRTYMNPFCTWVDGGRRFKCNVCAMLNEVPVEYFSTLDQNGVRRDIMERPELHCGTVEWVAPQEYMVRPPMPPVYFFAIDVSQAAYASGMVSVVAATIKDCLDKLPGDERTMVGFLTYDSSLHFYNIKPSLAAPQMLVVTELDEPFLPLPDDLLVNLHESRPVVEALLDALPNGYNSSTSGDSAMGPALQAAFLVMGHVGGKLLMFQSGLPTLGPGKLKPSRENLALYNTDREPTLRNPEDAFFKRFAGEASSRQITLDVFVGTNSFTDLASLASIPRYTCGQVYHYPGFHAPRDGSKLSAELTRNLTRPTAWEAVMRIRCSRGLKISSFHGHFFNRSTDLLALPTCDPDKAFAVQIGHEETMVNGPVAYVQCALLHTSSNGERRIRVHTMMLPVLSELSELYRASDGAATACLLAKLGVEKSLIAKLEDTRQALMAKLSAALKEYRLLHGAHVRNPGALIYPSTLKYLPAYVLGLVKSSAFRGGGRDVSADERAAAAHGLMAAPVEETLQLAYPDVYMLTDSNATWGTEQQGQVVLPPTVPASLAYIHVGGVYLVDNGQRLVLWIGREAAADWLVQVLGPDAASPSVDPSTLPLEPPKDTALSHRVCRIIQALRSRHTSSFAPAFAVRQGTPLEAHVIAFFVEDRSQGQFGYADFMQQLHRGVMNK